MTFVFDVLPAMLAAGAAEAGAAATTAAAAAAAYAPAAGLAGAAISAGGAIYGGMSQGARAAYMAQVAENNAKIAEENAVHAIHAGEAQAQAVSLRNAAAVGKLKAAQAANNVDVNSGSAVDTRVSQREAGELDTETTMSNAELTAYGYRAQATGYQAEAGLQQSVAQEAPIAGDIAGAGSLLSGVSSVGLKWAGTQSPFVPSVGGGSGSPNPLLSGGYSFPQATG